MAYQDYISDYANQMAGVGVPQYAGMESWRAWATPEDIYQYDLTAPWRARQANVRAQQEQARYAQPGYAAQVEAAKRQYAREMAQRAARSYTYEQGAPGSGVVFRRNGEGGVMAMGGARVPVGGGSNVGALFGPVR